MGGEPWCFPPAIIATLTDHVIEEAYLKPAVKKAEAMERERKGLPAATPNPEPMTQPPPRNAVVSTMMGVLGMTREAAEAEYDRQLAEWEAQKRK